MIRNRFDKASGAGEAESALLRRSLARDEAARLFELTVKARARGGSHVTERHIVSRICRKCAPYFSDFGYTRIALAVWLAAAARRTYVSPRNILSSSLFGHFRVCVRFYGKIPGRNSSKNSVSQPWGAYRSFSKTERNESIKSFAVISKIYDSTESFFRTCSSRYTDVLRTCKYVIQMIMKPDDVKQTIHSLRYLSK